MGKVAIACIASLAMCCSFSVRAQSGLADGFKKLPDSAKVVIMPMDIELFSMSAGGVLEPQAEWTNKALSNMRTAYKSREETLKIKVQLLDAADDADIEDLNRLHGAVGAAIVQHHLGAFKLPTKEGKFDWSLGEAVGGISRKTGADYALFTYVRDSYASSERVAAMIVGAMFGIGMVGGMQYGYASLVDLQTGQVVWFNQLLRGSGDLREPEPAKETLEALLAKFPS